MVKILKRARKNPFLNKVVRSILRRTNSTVFNRFRKKWRTSGVVTCEFGGYYFKMFNQCDDSLVDIFYYRESYEEEKELGIFLKLAADGKIVLDIGANTGLYSILGGIACPSSRFYAFEPNPTNADRFTRNVSINQLQNVHLYQSAMGETEGMIEISVPSNNSISDVSSVDASFSQKIYPGVSWKMIDVPVLTIDAFRKKHILRISVIKCDVETYEMSVFKGGRETFLKDKPAVIFECFPDERRAKFFNAFLHEFHYDLFKILPGGIVHMTNGMTPNEESNNFLIISRDQSSNVKF